MPDLEEQGHRNIAFAKPLFTEEAIKDILQGAEQVLRSGRLTSGPRVKQFEDEFARLLGMKYAAAVNSCTSALHSILLALGVGPGDEVIVPANTFVATANVAIYVGARPIIADVDPVTFNLSPDSVNERITQRTRAIIPVHVGGNPCDMRELSELAAENQVHLVEDCAHAHGAKIKESFCGTHSIASAFSFYPTKVMTTGEGGMILTNDTKIAEKVCKIRNVGRGGFGPSEITELGYNFRMQEISAVIGLRLLRDLGSYVSHRNYLAREYSNALSNIEWIHPQLVKEGNTCSYYSYIVVVEPKAPVSRDRLMEGLASFGIETSILYRPVHLQPFYRRLLRTGEGVAPVAEALGQRCLALPMWNGLTAEDVKYVATALRNLTDTDD